MRLLGIAFICLLSIVPATAQKPCQKSPDELKEREAKRLLSESPWSKKNVIVEFVKISALEENGLPGNPGPRGVIDGGRGYGADMGSGIHGEKELHYTYTCRLFSALPVRLAHIRLWRARSGYDKMSTAGRRAFDEQLSRLLTADTSEDIVVAFEFASNDRRAEMEVGRQLRELNVEMLRSKTTSATGEVLEQRPYLISDHLGRVELKAYYPPSADGTGAKLVFPRKIDNEPVVLEKDQEVKLELIVPGTGHKLYIVWKVKDLICDGQLLL